MHISKTKGPSGAYAYVGIEYLGHVAIGVSDLGNATHFYRDQLGLKEVFRLRDRTGSPMLIYLRMNDSNFVKLFPGLERQAAQGESKRTGLRHLGFLVKDLQATMHAPSQGRRLPLPDDALKQAAQSKLMVRFCISSETRMAMRLN